MVSGILALLECFMIYVNVKQGSIPGRALSPVEWEEFLSICPSISLSVHLPPSETLARPREAQARPMEALARAYEAQSKPWEFQVRPWEARVRP